MRALERIEINDARERRAEMSEAVGVRGDGWRSEKTLMAWVRSEELSLEYSY